MTFWLTVAALLVLAGGFVLGPFLLRGRRPPVADREHENVRIYRERLAELEHDREGMSEDELAQLKAELQRSLLGDVVHAETSDRGADPGRWLGYVVLPLVVVTSVAFYLVRGDMEGLNLADAFEGLEARQSADPTYMVEARELVAKLVSRVHRQPDNAEMWFLLGRTAILARDYHLASGAFRQVLALGADEIGVRSYLVQTLYLESGRQVTPEVQREIDAVFSRRPDEPTMLEILASDAFRREDFAAAADLLERGLRQPIGAERQFAFRHALELARAKMGGAGASEQATVATEPVPRESVARPGFEVAVDISPEVRRNLPPSTLVFILARAPGERMPLAVARRQVGELPATVVLDDSSAMNPARRLSTAEAVEIVARTAVEGSASSRSEDDVEAVAGPFQLEEGMTTVNLRLGGAAAL